MLHLERGAACRSSEDSRLRSYARTPAHSSAQRRTCLCRLAPGVHHSADGARLPSPRRAGTQHAQRLVIAKLAAFGRALTPLNTGDVQCESLPRVQDISAWCISSHVHCLAPPLIPERADTRVLLTRHGRDPYVAWRIHAGAIGGVADALRTCSWPGSAHKTVDYIIKHILLCSPLLDNCGSRKRTPDLFYVFRCRVLHMRWLPKINTRVFFLFCSEPRLKTTSKQIRSKTPPNPSKPTPPVVFFFVSRT